MLTYPVARRLVRRAWLLITDPRWAAICRPLLSLVTLRPPRVKLVVFRSRLRRRIAEAPIKLTLMCCFSLARSLLAVCSTLAGIRTETSMAEGWRHLPAVRSACTATQRCRAMDLPVLQLLSPSRSFCRHDEHTAIASRAAVRRSMTPIRDLLPSPPPRTDGRFPGST